MSTDPTALQSWLTQNGYDIPADITPIVSAYISEGFDFLALKLVPGQGISAMRPVRVTTPGASPVLPLRMVAAGTGTITPITLWVLAEGRYDTVNLPSFKVDPRPARLGLGHLVEQLRARSSRASSPRRRTRGGSSRTREPFSMYAVTDQLDSTVQYDPTESGYGDAMGNGAQQEYTDDMAALFSDIPVSSLWITRLEGELSRAALGADLQLGASSDQSQVSNFLQANQAIGTPPCPAVTPCGGAGGSASGATPGFGLFGGGHVGGGSGCALTGDSGAPLFGGAALLAALGLVRRRRARAR